MLNNPSPLLSKVEWSGNASTSQIWTSTILKWLMVLQIIASRSLSMTSSACQISWKSTSRLKSYWGGGQTDRERERHARAHTHARAIWETYFRFWKVGQKLYLQWSLEQIISVEHLLPFSSKFSVNKLRIRT
jgi:hypothetical protein